ncbi:MAG: hypothetical protein LBK47_05980 [Prevotellaceae bacterium]|jgi:hypothetical protein|nr:hypothetical protein [Prevotellaceae bacterium]
MKQLFIAALIAALHFTATAQNIELDSLIFNSMRQELQRSRQLSLPELSKPFFTSYLVQDEQTMSMSATLGGLLYSRVQPGRSYGARLMVGSYEQTNELFRGNAEISGSLSIDNSCSDIRQALWLANDALYKHAAEQMAQKLSAIKQSNFPEDEKGLLDFSHEPEVRLEISNIAQLPKQAEWEQNLREISAVFQSYPDISSSSVSLYVSNSNLYFVNTEGTQVKQPHNHAELIIYATLIQADGKRIQQKISVLERDADSLPKLDSLKQMAHLAANQLLQINHAPKFSESYSGPVLFEGKALGSILLDNLYSGTYSLFSYRGSVTGTRPKTLSDKLNKKIIANSLTVKDVPSLCTYNNKALVGSYTVDLEGVIPQPTTTLVENGMLRRFLNDRIPTKVAPRSTGNTQLNVVGHQLTTAPAPSVAKIEGTGGVSSAELKQKLIGMAKDEGFDYTYIIRELSTLTHPFLIYRVNVATGEEELMQGAELGHVGLSKLKRIPAISNTEWVDNISFSNALVSAIYPNGMIVEDVDIDRERDKSTVKAPVVENPLKVKKEEKTTSKKKK